METESEVNVTPPTGIALFKKLMKQESKNNESTKEHLSEDQQDEMFLKHLKTLATRTKRKLKN